MEMSVIITCAQLAQTAPHQLASELFGREQTKTKGAETQCFACGVFHRARQAAAQVVANF
jgi:hypothetical protein